MTSENIPIIKEKAFSLPIGYKNDLLTENSLSASFAGPLTICAGTFLDLLAEAAKAQKGPKGEITAKVGAYLES